MTDTLEYAVNSALTAESGSRTITGLVLPWGSIGRTNAGAVRVRPGAVRLPADLTRIKLFGLGHDRETPVAYATSAQVTAAGLVMTFRVAPTPAGDLALSEALARVRDAFSVELDDVTRSGDEIVAAALTAVGLVTVPAFPDARITQVAAAADQPEVTMSTATLTDPGPLPDSPDDAPAAPPAQPGPPTAPADDPSEDDDAQDYAPQPVLAAARPAALSAGAPRTRQRPLSTLYEAMVGMATGAVTPEVAAALADITHTANAWVQPTQYESELWSGVPYTRQVVPLLTQRPLTSYNISGWRWKVKPVVAPYAGDKAAVPTNPATTEAANATASRLAGAHDFDRKFLDFGDTAFFQSYYEAMAASWALQSDTAAAAFLVANAAAMAGTGETLLLAAVTAAMQVKADTGAAATFALCNPADWLTLFTTTTADAPAFLSLAPFGPEGIIPTALVPAGKVVVGTKPAVSWYERAGSPIRVETVNLANGGIDGGVFGYYALLLNDAKGLVSNTVTPPVAQSASTGKAK